MIDEESMCGVPKSQWGLTIDGKRRASFNNRYLRRWSKDVLALVWGFDGHCLYCGCDLALADAVADHIEQIWGLAYSHWRNLIVCCRRCNSRKHSHPVEQFLAELYPAKVFNVDPRQIVLPLTEKRGEHA